MVYSITYSCCAIAVSLLVSIGYKIHLVELPTTGEKYVQYDIPIFWHE